MMKRPNECTPMGEYKCQVPMPLNGRVQCVDFCIADIVAALNAAGIKTTMSCCGHGDDRISLIMLEDGRNLHLSNIRGITQDKLRDGIESAMLHLRTNYDVNGDSMKDSDAYKELEDCLKA